MPFTFRGVFYYLQHISLLDDKLASFDSLSMHEALHSLLRLTFNRLGGTKIGKILRILCSAYFTFPSSIHEASTARPVLLTATIQGEVPIMMNIPVRAKPPVDVTHFADTTPLEVPSSRGDTLRYPDQGLLPTTAFPGGAKNLPVNNEDATQDGSANSDGVVETTVHFHARTTHTGAGAATSTWFPCLDHRCTEPQHSPTSPGYVPLESQEYWTKLRDLVTSANYSPRSPPYSTSRLHHLPVSPCYRPISPRQVTRVVRTQ